MREIRFRELPAHNHHALGADAIRAVERPACHDRDSQRSKVIGIDDAIECKRTLSWRRWRKLRSPERLYVLSGTERQTVDIAHRSDAGYRAKSRIEFVKCSDDVGRARVASGGQAQRHDTDI